MIDVSKAFEVNEEGFAVTNSDGDTLFYIATGTGAPTGNAAPVNTFYFDQSTQLIYYKFGAGNNDWRQLRAQDVAFNVSSLLSNSPDLTGLAQTFAVVSALANRNFGKGFGVAFTAGNFQTTSGSFQTIQTVTPGTFTNGDYIAISYGRYLKTLPPGQIETRFLLNGSTEFSQDEISLDDDDFFFGHTSIAYLPGLTTSPTINFQFRKSDGRGNIQAENRLLLLWRVS